MAYFGIVAGSFIIISLILWYVANEEKKGIIDFFSTAYKTPKFIIICVMFILAEILNFKVYGVSAICFEYFILICILSAIALEDYLTQYISNKFIIVLLIGGIIFLSINNEVNSINALAAFIICGGSLFILSKISKEALGMGDTMVVACLGIWLGIFNVLTTIVYASIMSAAVGGYQIIKNRENKKKTLPFAPFILAGLLLNLLL